MTAPPDELDPVRAELLRAARAAAEAAVRQARSDAARTLRAARADAGRVLAQARELGAGDGRAAAARERVRAAEDAWSRELAARAEVYAELRADVRAGVRRALAEGAAPPATPTPGTGLHPPVSGSEIRSGPDADDRPAARQSAAQQVIPPAPTGASPPTGPEPHVRPEDHTEREPGNRPAPGQSTAPAITPPDTPAQPCTSSPAGPAPPDRTEVRTDPGAGDRAGIRRAPGRSTVSAVRLADTARAVLGPEARITAAPGGGITADVPGRHLDLSADTLADRALERMGGRIESLWGGP
ncbi:hypothetical protein AB0M32_25505 [Streptomyces sp. NPDC051985]|uniref:hypothetical protein n=1 Tax=Streptomyces sp. NPDC051985 TaxID=3155807 RepID=UPI0034400700